MAYVANRVRDDDDGTGVSGKTVTVRRIDGGATVDTPSTDANGRFEYKGNGSPGYVEWSATHDNQTRVVAGNKSEQFGAFYSGELEKLIAAFGVGVISGVDSELAVGAPGGMFVSVAAGAAIIKGLPYVGWASANLAIGANASGNPRIDRVVLRVTRTGADYGKAEAAVKAGTPAASPVAPGLTQDVNTWEISLAQVAVASGAGAIAGGNITDERSYAAPPIGAGAVTSAMLAGSIDAAKISGGTVSNTEFDYLNNVTSAIQTQLNGKVADFTQYMAAAVVLGNGVDVISSAETAIIVPIPDGCDLVRIESETLVGSAGNLRLNITKAAGATLSYSAIDASDPFEHTNDSAVYKTSFTGWDTTWDQYDKVKIAVDGAVAPTNIKQLWVAFYVSKARA